MCKNETAVFKIVFATFPSRMEVKDFFFLIVYAANYRTGGQ